jgi:hypothetical protein
MSAVLFLYDLTEHGSRVRSIAFPIREVPASNLGPETNYIDWGLSLFS